MLITNKDLFDKLSSVEYFKSNKQAKKIIKRIDCYPEVLGYDAETEGFVVFHRNHAPAAMPDEMPACIVLKRLGFGVILLDENIGIFVPDALIEARFFEIKRMSKAKNLKGAVNEHFRNTYRKAPNLVLHIDQPANPNSLRTAIVLATKNYPEIRSVWVIYLEKLWRLDRKVIVKGHFQLQ